MLHNLFTYNAWSFEYQSNLKDYCDTIRKNGLKSIKKSNLGGFQSQNLNLEEPILQPLLDCIKNETLNYHKNFDVKIPHLYISSMWININGYKDSNIEHIHGDSIYSGVYYIHTPKDCGHIEFIRPDGDLMDCNWCNLNRLNYNSLNSNTWWLPSKTHTGYIFPSYYKHRVQPNLNTEERYSVSFNIKQGEKPKTYT